MNKEMFIKHANMLTKANDTWYAIEQAIGGDFENALTRVMEAIPEFYAEFCKPDIDKEMYYEIFWDLVNDGEFDSFIRITNWEEFYDYFFGC